MAGKEHLLSGQILFADGRPVWLWKKDQNGKYLEVNVLFHAFRPVSDQTSNKDKEDHAI